ncbi:MoxR-like ATPase [Hydrogenispora ethanolica]|uniref:MoxR-like ATPase n=1 Tax=Hydrogenispora ethanolica TaxID=1082276 RepID=A0A4R1RD31_HYDET|nr:MoxR family ATPase [Hydrogenispora ethanolica]TCL63775.1 MoxR-like ATPase [Hydrogenispora ethanolica]
MFEGLTVVTEAVKSQSEFVPKLKEQIRKVLVGQEKLIDGLLIGLLANGHVLLEGVPGLAKTLSVKALAAAIQADFQRIQFTPDLLPADLVGTLIYNPQSGQFSTKRGPVFANIILADEINRAPAKVQSALLEAMEEKQVTIGEHTYALPEPFTVLATQNPIEQQGTYPLPEAQLDRFMLKLKIGYPTKEEELQIMERMAQTSRMMTIQPVITPPEILAVRKVIDQIYLDAKIRDYIVNLVMATRNPQGFQLDLADYIEYGASPRATISLAIAAKAYAFMQGRAYVIPNDIKTIGPDVFRHRIMITYEAEANEISAEHIIQTIFAGVPVP